VNPKPDASGCLVDRSVRSFPFVIEAKSIAGGTVKETCFAAIGLSRHLRCMVETEINDTKITVCGAIMTGEDAYEQWLHYSANTLICNMQQKDIEPK
jgi:hypothetical protein